MKTRYLSHPTGRVKALVKFREVSLTALHQDDAEAKLRVLEEAAASAQKMTSHLEADGKVAGFKERWTVVHECFKEWVAR